MPFESPAVSWGNVWLQQNARAMMCVPTKLPMQLEVLGLTCLWALFQLENQGHVRKWTEAEGLPCLPKWAQHGRTENTGSETILVRDKQKQLCPVTLWGIPPSPASHSEKQWRQLESEPFTQLWLRTVGRIQQHSSVWLQSTLERNHCFSASPAPCSTFGFRNPIYTVGLSSTMGLRGEPLRMVPKFPGGKKTDVFCQDTCRIVSGGLAVQKKRKILQRQLSLQS